MTSTSILFSWVAENRWRLFYSEKPESDPEDKLREGENTSDFSFYSLLCKNLMQLPLKVTSPVPFLMMGRISGLGLSAEINQKYNLRVTVTMCQQWVARGKYEGRADGDTSQDFLQY